jgi:translation initiation factor IF-3
VALVVHAATDFFHPHRSNQETVIQPIYQRVNQRIRAREVMTIGPEGQPLGILQLSDALAKARQFGLDLVEIAPNARPPVCKILDYGKFKYEIAKRERETKKQNLSAKVKELKFHLNTDTHDYMVKMRHAEDFLFKGMKVKAMLVLRGREMLRKEDGRVLAVKIVGDLAHVAAADNDPKLVGRNINMMLTPLPVKKRVRKYTVEDQVYEDVPEGAEDGHADDDDTPSDPSQPTQ